MNDSDLEGRFAGTNILPPVRSAWEKPAFDKPNPYWSGQKLGREFANLAPQVPSQYTHPFIGTAKAKFSEALTTCVQEYEARGDTDFEAFVRKTLKEKADEVRRQIARNPY